MNRAGELDMESRVLDAYADAGQPWKCVRVRALPLVGHTGYALERDGREILRASGWASFEQKMKAFLLGMKEASRAQ